VRVCGDSTVTGTGTSRNFSSRFCAVTTMSSLACGAGLVAAFQWDRVAHRLIEGYKSCDTLFDCAIFPIAYFCPSVLIDEPGLILAVLALDALICWLLFKFAGKRLNVIWPAVVCLGYSVFLTLLLLTYSLTGTKLPKTATPNTPAPSASSKPPRERAVSGAPFCAALPETEIELLGISVFQKSAASSKLATHDQMSPLTNKVWWRPDGTPLNQKIDYIHVSFSVPDRDVYELAFKVGKQSNGVPDVIMDNLPNSRSSSAGTSSTSGARKPEDILFQQTLSCVPGLQEADLRLGVASSAWTTDHRYRASSSSSGTTECGSIFISVTDAGQETVVTCQYQRPTNCQSRLVALGPKGEIAPVRLGPASGVERAQSVTLTYKTEALKDASLCLQSRPYHWVEFHNVSLKPGVKTQVKVIDAGPQAPVANAEQPQPAANLPAVNALESTWSPTLAPGEKPDLQIIYNSAKSLADAGKYEEALQRYLWYFEHSRYDKDQGQGGVRLSFVLSDWVELGHRYPKAKQALQAIRDQNAQQLLNGDGSGVLFQEVAGINQQFFEKDRTLELFDAIAARNPDLAKQYYYFAQNLLVEKGEYAKCLRYLENPQKVFERYRSSWKLMKQLDERRAQQNERLKQRMQTMTRTNPAFANAPELPMPSPHADNYFVQQTRQLVEILVGAGRQSDAEDIQKQAVEVLDTSELRAAVSDALKTVKQRKPSSTPAP